MSGQEYRDAMERQRKRREMRPLFYCKLVANYPVQTFLATLGGHVMMIVISVVLLAAGYDLLPVDFESLPLEIRDEPPLPRHWAWNTKDEFPEYYDRTPSSGYRIQAHRRANLFLYYDTGGGNIFTKENLKVIKAIEDRLTDVPGYVNDYCLWNYAISECAKPVSIIRYFDGTFAPLNQVFNDPAFDNIDEVIYEATRNVKTRADFQFFLSRSYNSTPTYAYSSITRSMIPMGYPIPAANNTEDYENVIKEFMGDTIKPILEEIAENTGEFEFIYRSHVLFLDIVFTQAMKDVLCAIGSICFIFVFILFHTRSLWITFFAVFSIITSFLCGNLIYRIVFDFRYLGFFHILTIFIILGIGADDIYVFYDIWGNTAYEKYPSLAHRLSDTYRKSAFSMLFTSLTTAVAFFANTISPLLATRSFGLFSGLVIIANYISVIVYFPTVVIMYHTKFKQFRWPCFKVCDKCCEDCCDCCSDTNEQQEYSEKYVYKGDDTETKFNHCHENEVLEHELDNGTANDTKHRIITELTVGASGELRSVKVRDINTPENSTDDTEAASKIANILPHTNPRTHVTSSKENGNIDTANGCVNIGFTSDNTNKNNYKANDTNLTNIERPVRTVDGTNETRGVSRKVRKQPAASRFFSTRYFAVVTHPVLRWIILAVAAAVLAFFIIQATKLEPDNEGLTVLRDSHVLMKAENHDLNSFVQSNEDIRLIIYIIWGMLQNDLSDCHFSTPKCKGKHVWDPDFNPSTPEAQLAVRRFCDTMYSFSNAKADEFRLKRNINTGEYQINCFIKDLGQYLDEESAITGTNWSLPYDYNKAISFMEARPEFYDSSKFNSSYKDFLEIPISHWMSSNNTFDYTNAFYLYDELIGEGKGPFSTQLKTDQTRYYGNDIRYMAIQVNTTIKYQTLGYAEGIPIMELWENFVNDEMAKMPEGMNNAFQMTPLIWHWIIVSQTLAKNAIYGIVIGVSVAFPILVIATGNIVTGTLATFSMCCSTVCVLGVIPLGGWKLGVIASLNMCMVVGLTVDYVVHLAEAYSHSLHRDRQSRLRDMLAEVAVPVFFGACTSLGASLFMFIAQLSFFFQFGIFMFTTIGFSLFFSMTMFVTLLGLVGPQNDTGDILIMCRKLRNWCKNK